MAKKKTFVLRVNPETMQAVERWAADDFRSINGQLEWIIHNALKNAKRLKRNAEK
ncbi:MAG: Arc family DNA binding domain-containing protein [Draconibacterium sp.]|nr:Arc family DNA binding domain-containing protein [Draconibacterium sp.]